MAESNQVPAKRLVRQYPGQAQRAYRHLQHLIGPQPQILCIKSSNPFNVQIPVNRNSADLKMERSTSIVVAAAIIAHFILFPIHEASTIKVLKAYSFANTILFGIISSSHHELWPSAARLTILNSTFLLVFVFLTVIRRLYFCPLSHIPGPKLAAISNIWLANEFRTGRGSHTLLKLHKQYNSDFIRIGPRELSIRNVEAVEAIYRGKYPRGTFYEVGAMNGEFNLNTQRDYKLHTPWRRIWYVLEHCHNLEPVLTFMTGNKPSLAASFSTTIRESRNTLPIWLQQLNWLAKRRSTVQNSWRISLSTCNAPDSISPNTANLAIQNGRPIFRPRRRHAKRHRRQHLHAFHP